MKYYVDAVHGSDQCDGLRPDSAWKNLDRPNTATFAPGDQLLLRRGCEWRGTLRPGGEGTAGIPILLSAYGEGELPRIDGGGAVAAVMLCGQSHWVIRKIHAMNQAQERSVRHGIFIQGSERGITRDITVEQCEISHVTGQNRREVPPYTSMYWNGAVYASQPGRSTAAAHFEGLCIHENYIHDVYTSGIRVAQHEDGIVDIFHRNVVIRGNRIERTGSDGIIIANSVSPLIEGNTCHDAGALGTLEDTRLIAGIWVCSVSDAILRRNEVARTRLFENDGTAFDTDWGVSGTILFEDNYSYENQGGFFLDCGGLNLNPGYVKTILRGNVSVNDHRCVVQDAHSPRVELIDNVFVQTREGVTLCLHQPGTQHAYQGNTFAYPTPPPDGWQSVDLRQNHWTQETPELGAQPPEALGFAKWRELYSGT